METFLIVLGTIIAFIMLFTIIIILHDIEESKKWSDIYKDKDHHRDR